MKKNFWRNSPGKSATATLALAAQVLIGQASTAFANPTAGVVVDPKLVARPDAASSTDATTSDSAAPSDATPTPPAAPLHPFFINLFVLNSPVSGGTAGRRLNITSIVLTNFDASPQQVYIFAPVFASSSSCTAQVTGGATPNLQVYVQPQQTLVIPFPTPLVIAGLRPNCIAAEVTTQLHGGSVQMDVTGYY